MSNIVPRDMQDDEWSVAVATKADALPITPPDFVTPDYLGEMDAEEGFPFAPEAWFADRFKQTLYAAGYASVKGPSHLTDTFLLGSAEGSIEDDHAWIRGGC